MEKEQDNQILEAVDALSSSLRTVQLATLSQEQEASISYTPFIKHRDDIYIFISELAPHTQNILRHPTLSALFIEDEQDSKNVFARKRLILKCQCEEIEKENKNWSSILDAFELRQGNTVKLLRSLPDFHLFKLHANSGTYIQGFGQAFELSGEQLKKVRHISRS